MKRWMLALTCLLLTGCSFEQNAYNPVVQDSTAEQTQANTDSAAETTQTTEKKPLNERVDHYYILDHATGTEENPHIIMELRNYRVLETYTTEQGIRQQYLSVFTLQSRKSGEIRTILFRDEEGVQKEIVTQSIPVYGSEGFWALTAEHTVGIYSYDLELLHEITIPEGAVYGVDFASETLYYAADDAITAISFDGTTEEFCTLDGLEITQLHACETELIFVGNAVDGSCYGRIPLSTKEITYKTRTDDGTYLLSPFDYGAMISDADRYEMDTVSGEIHILRDGKDTLVQNKYDLESKAAFIAPDGKYIATTFAQYVPEADSIYIWKRIYDENGAFYIKQLNAQGYKVQPQNTEPFFAGAVAGEDYMLDHHQLYITSQLQSIFFGMAWTPESANMFYSTAFTEDIMQSLDQWPDCLEE